MKRVVKEINGEKRNVLVIENLGSIEIYGTRMKDVQKKDGTWKKVVEARTNRGLVTLSDSLYDAIKKNSLPDDSKLYLTLQYVGIQGTGSGSFEEF